MLVADALRLGGAILGSHPDMLAPQLIGRLLPEIGGNVNVKMLLRACDNDGAKNCALLPVYHCLHTPGGPLKVNGRNWPIKRKIKFSNREKFFICRPIIQFSLFKSTRKKKRLL